MEGSNVANPGLKRIFTIKVLHVILRIKIMSQASTGSDISEILTNIHSHAHTLKQYLLHSHFNITYSQYSKQCLSLILYNKLTIQSQ